MPYIDYYLSTKIKLTKDSLTATELTSSLTSNLDLGKDNRTWNKKQLEALTLILCNLVKHHHIDNGVFLYSRKNRKNIPESFNPLNIGNKPLFFVLDKLRRADLIEDITAPPRATGYNPERLSEFHVTQEVLDLAYSLGINRKTVDVLPSLHVSLRDMRLNNLTYKPNAYTKYTEELMSRYCKHLNKQSIMLKTSDDIGEGIIEYGSMLGGEKIHLYRRYKNWTDIEILLPDISILNSKIPNKNFNIGGRSGGYWMDGLAGKKENRPTLIINGKPTASVDFPCSHLNLCYRHETSNWYQQETYQELKAADREYEDGYIVSTKIDRALTKQIIQLMFNVKSKSAVSKIFNEWLRKEGNEEHNYNKLNSGYETIEIQEEILKHHYKIKDYFYKGKIAGQVIQWEEANLMFNIADQYIREHKITTLTVHDELIVQEEHQPLAREFMFSSGHNETCSKYSLMNKIKDL